LQTINNRAGVFAGSAVRLLDGDGLAGLRLTVLDEGLVEILIRFLRRILRGI
jgi:hypothetical protein